jgi:hypothetical protein
MKKKSKYYIILTSLMVLLTSSNLAIKTKAHPPSSIIIGYIPSTQMVTVFIGHGVSDPFVHYVNQIIIRVNGSQVLSTLYTNQSTVSGGVYTYSPIVANNGSRIEVIATCIEGGSISSCLIVPDKVCSQSGGPEIPGYFGFWLIVGFSIIVSIMVTYKKIWPRKYLKKT